MIYYLCSVQNTGYIEITISGKKGNHILTPDNFDIREIIAVLENAENLLYPGDKKDRPPIAYRIEEGSVKNILKTSIQYVIGFNAVIGQIESKKTIDFLDLNTAKAFENLQDMAAMRDYVLSIRTSLDQSNEVSIDKSTRYYRTEAIWVDAEFYLYGRITNAGGKDKANIHIFTDDYGTLRIQTPISFLEEYDNNLLYRPFGIRVSGKQHSETGELDVSTLKFIELVDYLPKYDEQYLQSLREKAKKSWLGKISPDEWLNQLRGGYDA